MKKFKDRKGINLLTIFLVIDLLAVFASLNTSGAVYQANASGNIALDVAYYAFRYDLENEASQNIDIELGDIQPGEEKKYKINIYNTDETDKVADTSLSYILKIVTTTNVKFEYGLYYNQSKDSANAFNLLSDGTRPSDKPEVIKAIQADNWGTYFNSFIVEEICLAHTTKTHDFFYLTIKMPDEFKTHVEYQDLIESVKVQIESKQVLKSDITNRGLTCH